MWQCKWQLAFDLEDVRNSKDDGAGEENVRKRRGTVGSRSSRKYRRSIIPTAISSANSGSDSEVDEETGRLIAGSDSEEESSEAEWQGWMADLFRQQKVQAQEKRVQEEAEAAGAEKFGDLEGDRIEEPPKTPAEDRRHQLERRRAFEPVGIVTTMYSNTPPSSTGTFYAVISF
jgi:hypothetical protein